MTTGGRELDLADVGAVPGGGIAQPTAQPGSQPAAVPPATPTPIASSAAAAASAPTATSATAPSTPTASASAVPAPTQGLPAGRVAPKAGRGGIAGDAGKAGKARAGGAGGRRAAKRRRIMGMTVKRFAATVVLPLVCLVIIVGTLIAAPAGERGFLVGATLVALAAGMAATAIGVYGGVLVPGLLLLGVDARLAAAASLFLQVLVIPLGAGAHYRLGNVSRQVALPLIIGGVAGAFIGPFFAAALPSDVIKRLVAAMIVGVGAVVLATIGRGGLGEIRPRDDVPFGKVTAVGGVAGFSSGISGAGWGPIGVKLLILMRIEPKAAIGSSLVGRTFMAASAVVAYILSASAFKGVNPDWWLLVLLFAGSVAAMVPGAFVVSHLGREKATVGITLLSICLALPTLIGG